MRHVPSTAPAYQVRTVHCDHRADDEAVYQALLRATDPLERAWARLSRAKRIAVKFTRTRPSSRLCCWPVNDSNW